MNNKIKNKYLFQKQSYNSSQINTWISYKGETLIMPINPSTVYNLRNAMLKNGAKINRAGTMVTALGGKNEGYAIIAINIHEGGKYNIYLSFRIGVRPFRIDINEVSTGEVYITPNEKDGIFNTVMNLNQGVNILKFYGEYTKSASTLGAFTLVKVLPKPVEFQNNSYDIARGYLENGANINPLTGFVTGLGGRSDGSSTVTVKINKAGKYNVAIEYLAYDIDVNFEVDINGVSIGYYEPPSTDGWALDNVLKFTFDINLNLGSNEIKFHGDKINPSPDFGIFSLTKVKETPVYDYATFNSLSFYTLVNLLKSINYTDIKGLYDFTPESEEFFKNSARVDAIISAIISEGKVFTLMNNEGLQTLIEVLRAGHSLGYNNDELKYLEDLNQKQKCLPAIKAVQKNPDFKLVIDVDNKVIKSIARLIEYTTLDVDVINNFIPILEQFKINIKLSKKEYKKRDSIYKILRSVESILNEFLEANGNSIKDIEAYGNIDSFLTSLEDLAFKGSNSPSYASELFINIIEFVGKFSKFRSDKTPSQIALTNCVNIYPYFSRMNIEALIALKRYFNGKFSDGSDINYKIRIEKARNYYLPNWYKFDNGKIIIRAGSKISAEKIKILYWSIKEVRAQFFRISGNETPLESGNIDDILNIVIYDSLEEFFNLNRRLYNYNTKGMGGVYLEHLGIIYTTERTLDESTFKLEEIFRHEYVHYLEQRFLIPGIDNTGDFYENGNSKRLLWFGEGLADLLTGSTRKDGIKVRKSMVGKLEKNTLESIKSIVKVDAWKAELYDDYYALMYYLYTCRRDILNNARDIIMNNEVTLYDNLMDTLAHDIGLNNDFHRVVKDLIDNLGSLTIPLASEDYLISHPNRSIQQIREDILSIICLQNITTNIEVSDYFKTFILSGIYNAGVSIDELTDFTNMDKVLNRVLKYLDFIQWSGYKTVTAYFTEYTVNNNNEISFKVTFHGFFSNKIK